MRRPCRRRKSSRSSWTERRYWRISSTVFEGRGNGRSAYHLGHPADALLDLIHHGPLTADDEAGGEGLDRDLACLFLEVDVLNLGLLRNELPDGGLRLFHRREEGGVRTDGHPSAQPLG
jgi:hypothetical protein